MLQLPIYAILVMEVIDMEPKEVIQNLRYKSGMSQDELAEKVFVTRQAVSRWENGETIPNTETLKLLSKLFNVSINTLLGSPRNLICQCCGMPLDDSSMSKDKDGVFNEEYCKWCYTDGEYVYKNMDDLIEVCIPHMVSENFKEDAARIYLKEALPKLNYWKNNESIRDDNLDKLKDSLIFEFNSLNIKGLPKVESLNPLVGKFINLPYPLSNGEYVKFLEDSKVYYGNQLKSTQDYKKYFGVLGDSSFLMVVSYEENLKNPELILYKKR